ncbi:MAG: TetR family transcriptional regulator C-terminal domain-containing protein [Ktedonobacteraceae bacterium]
MGKAEQTHQRIIVQSAPLFNQHGYSGTSMQDILRVTDLKKGGIYSHFESKAALAHAVFDYAVGLMNERFTTFLTRAPASCLEQVFASIEAFASVVYQPPVAGGCATLNTAIESDDAFPLFKQQAGRAMDAWFKLVAHLLREGIRKQEFRPEINVEEVATTMIASLEGALMLSKLYDDPIHMERVVKHLRSYLISELAR